MKCISNFRGKHRFLSNFHASTVTYDEQEYPTVEHAYQAAKTFNQSERKQIQKAATPGEAKALGQKVTLRSDWEEVKLDVMTRLVRQKFMDHPDLKRNLLDTDDAHLMEGNTWGDRFWGCVIDYDDRNEEYWSGENQLGIILMKVRGELRYDRIRSVARSQPL